MADSESFASPENVDDEMTDSEKYKDIGRAEDYFREKLGVDKTAYIILGSVYGHIAYTQDFEMSQEPEEYIVNEYRKAERRVDAEFHNLSMTDIYNNSFIQEQIANYIEEKVMSGRNTAFESLRWKIDNGLQHIVDTSADPISDTQDAVDNPIIADGGTKLVEPTRVEEEKPEYDSYDTYYQFIYRGLGILAERKSDALVQRMLDRVPDSREHRYRDSFYELLRKSIMDKRRKIAKRATEEVDKKMGDTEGMSRKEEIKVAVQGGLMTEAVKISLQHLYEHGSEHMKDVLGKFDSQTVTTIFQEIGDFICENIDLIMSSLPF